MAFLLYGSGRQQGRFPLRRRRSGGSDETANKWHAGLTVFVSHKSARQIY